MTKPLSTRRPPVPFDYPEDFPKASINAVELAHIEATREFKTASLRHSGRALEPHFVSLILRVVSSFLSETVKLVKAERWDLAEARTQAENFLHQVIVDEYYDNQGPDHFPPLKIFEPQVTTRILDSEPWRRYEDGLTKAAAASVKKSLRGSPISRVAADRVLAFLEHTNTERTGFATSVGIDPRTLREFLRTGRIRRSTLVKIAAKMGTDLTTLCKP
jgi:hypothetical protein